VHVNLREVAIHDMYKGILRSQVGARGAVATCQTSHPPSLHS